MKIKLRIRGTPVAKARPKFFRRGDHVGTYKPKEQEAAEVQFKSDVRRQLEVQRVSSPIPAKHPVRVKCWFLMPIPKSSSKKFRAECAEGVKHHVKKPDTDNLVKFVKDCLNGIAWHDDSQVCELSAIKYYSDKPGTVIVIEALEAA